MSFIYWFTAQMPTIARAGLGLSLEPGIPSGSPKCVAEIRGHEFSSAAFQGVL